MAVNAFQQTTASEHNEQEPVSLVSLNPDGSLLVHPAIAKQFLPQLFGNVLSPTYTLHRDTQEPILRNIGNTQQTEGTSSENSPVRINPYAQVRADNVRQGRKWSSEVRRLMRTGHERYEAMQIIADREARPVTDVRQLVEFNNKTVKPRGKAIRQAILWNWHCQGSTHRSSAERFPFNIHEKTVAADIMEVKEMLNRQNGGMQNVR